MANRTMSATCAGPQMVGSMYQVAMGLHTRSRWIAAGMYGDDGLTTDEQDRGTAGAPCYRTADRRPQGAWRSQWDEYTHGKVNRVDHVICYYRSVDEQILYISRSALLGDAVISIGHGAKVVARGHRAPIAH